MGCVYDRSTTHLRGSPYAPWWRVRWAFLVRPSHGGLRAELSQALTLQGTCPVTERGSGAERSKGSRSLHRGVRVWRTQLILEVTIEEPLGEDIVAGSQSLDLLWLR